MQERKSVIDLPVKLVLTEEGTSFFIRKGKNLKKFKLADNVEEYGIILDTFSPASLQRMMLVDYISKVEISKSEFMSSRQEIMDLSKLVVYSMLYRQYDACVFARVLASDVIKKWNQPQPRQHHRRPDEDQRRLPPERPPREGEGRKGDIKEEILSRLCSPTSTRTPPSCPRRRTSSFSYPRNSWATCGPSPGSSSPNSRARRATTSSSRTSAAPSPSTWRSPR